MKTLVIIFFFALFAGQAAFSLNLDQEVSFGYAEETDSLQPFKSYSLRSELKRAVDTSLVEEDFNITGLGTPYSGRVFRDLASAYTGQIQDGLVNLRAQDEEETSILSSNTLGNFTDSEFNITESFETTPGYVVCAKLSQRK